MICPMAHREKGVDEGGGAHCTIFAHKCPSWADRSKPKWVCEHMRVSQREQSWKLPTGMCQLGSPLMTSTQHALHGKNPMWPNVSKHGAKKERHTWGEETETRFMENV